MGLEDIGKSNQQTRDQIGSEPTVQDIYKIKSDVIVIELGPEQNTQRTDGHSFILGSANNGKLGVNTATEDGQQQVLGSAGQVDTVIRVINENNKHIERFKFTTFKDSDNTTANWSTSDGKVIF